MLVAGYYGITLAVCLCVCLSVHLFLFVCLSIYWVLDDNLINEHGFSPNLVYAMILWRSGLGLLMGKFHQILTELSAHDISIFLFLVITSKNE